MMHKAWHNIEEVSYWFSMSSIKFQDHTEKNHQFGPELSVSELLLQFEFTDGFEMMHKAWCSIEEVPYYFSKSSIEFQGHTGWKIDNLYPIWVRLLGRLQLSNPSDLPCYFNFTNIILITIPIELNLVPVNHRMIIIMIYFLLFMIITMKYVAWRLFLWLLCWYPFIIVKSLPFIARLGTVRYPIFRWVAVTYFIEAEWRMYASPN